MELKSSTLVRRVDKVFTPPGLPRSITDELERDVEHPENVCLYDELKGVEWRLVSADTIEATYASIFLLTDSLLAYYLPAILRHILVEADAFVLEGMILRMLPNWRRRAGFDRSQFCRRYDLSAGREAVFADVLRWSIENCGDLGWKDVLAIENYLRSKKQESVMNLIACHWRARRVTGRWGG